MLHTIAACCWINDLLFPFAIYSSKIMCVWYAYIVKYLLYSYYYRTFSWCLFAVFLWNSGWHREYMLYRVCLVVMWLLSAWYHANFLVTIALLSHIPVEFPRWFYSFDILSSLLFSPPSLSLYLCLPTPSLSHLFHSVVGLRKRKPIQITYILHLTHWKYEYLHFYY